MKNKNFYDELILNNKKNSFFNYNTRFEQTKILNKKNINIYFDKIVKKYINNKDIILDYGCGSGVFTYKISKFTKKKVIGTDVSKEFIKNSKVFFRKHKNLEFKITNGDKTIFKSNKFDKILMVDVIHHLENIDKVFRELKRILKKNGKILVFEPNLLNPLIFLLHLIEKNERGLLKLGLKKKYIQICKKHKMKIDFFSFNGIVIGPNSIFFETISKLLNYGIFKKILGWLNPKIFFVIKNN